MRQFWNIAVNAFMELIRQPVFLLLMTGSVVFEIFLAVPYYFAFGDEPKLVENSVLAVMLLTGLFGAVLSASCRWRGKSAAARRWPFCPSRKPGAISAGQVCRPCGGARHFDLCEPGRRVNRQPDGV